MGNRREYSIKISLNQRRFTSLVIDPHYEKNHPDITDQIILELVKQLEGTESDPEDEKDGFAYFARELRLNEKTYRVVITYCDEPFLGIVNAFRVREKKI